MAGPGTLPRSNRKTYVPVIVPSPVVEPTAEPLSSARKEPSMSFKTKFDDPSLIVRSRPSRPAGQTASHMDALFGAIGLGIILQFFGGPLAGIFGAAAGA